MGNIYWCISGREGEAYVVDTWIHSSDGDGTSFSEWESSRTTTNLPPDVSVGDVFLSSPIGAEADTLDPADEADATTIYEHVRGYERRLETLAAEHDVDLDTPAESLSDGDVLLIEMPNEATYYGAYDETMYAFPGGVIAEGERTWVRNHRLLNCERDALDSGMAFDVLENEYRKYGLRFDREATERVQNDPALVRFYHDPLGNVEGVDSEHDLQWPLYVSLRDLDDGQYYADLYDSGQSQSSPMQKPGHRHLSSGSGDPPYRIPEAWLDADLIEVEELHLGDNEYCDGAVAVVPRDAVVKSLHE